MEEYISRDAALKAIVSNGIQLDKYVAGHRDCANQSRERILKIPTADVAPVRHGRWRYYKKQNIAVCQNCSFERDLDTNFGLAIACPNCGAKMDSEDIDSGNEKQVPERQA